MHSTKRPSARRRIRALLATVTASMIALGSFTMPAAASTDPITVAYIEVNDTELRTVGSYTLEDGSPVFDIAIIFAANINGTPTQPRLHLNERVQQTLAHAETQIRPLQQAGTKVTLSLLGNHDDAGFANFADRQAAGRFAQQVADVVRAFGLDGVDIDDEWVRYGQGTTPRAVPNSAVWLVEALDDKLPAGSIISLYDIGETANQLSRAPRSVVDKLDYIWNPYYGQYNPPSFPGAGRERLGAAAVDISATPQSTAERLAERTMQDGYGVYVTYNLQAGDRSADVSTFTRVLSGQNAIYTR